MTPAVWGYMSMKMKRVERRGTGSAVLVVGCCRQAAEAAW